MKSTLRNESGARGQALRRRALLSHGALLACAAALQALAPGFQPLALGLVWPGAGFLAWDGAAAAIAFLVSALAFGLALLAWFAMGAITAPPAIWLGSALIAQWGAPAEAAAPPAAALIFLAPAALAALLLRGRRAANVALAVVPRAATEPGGARELAPDDLASLRLFMDRALQPVERFDGFERRDQFQTAALRYQVQTMSYALSMASAEALPALRGPMAEAQRRLLAKLGAPINWRYWRLENALGHLSADPDPIARDNIMYSGFGLLQMALARKSLGGLDLGPLALEGAHGVSKRWREDALADMLARQYRSATMGLLPCEPHWIYPLCNLITAAGLRAADPAAWSALAPRFFDHLDREFTRSDGAFVPFRSSALGFAPPPLGGVIVDAFACFFLNALCRERAAAHWARVMARVDAKGSWRRALWPIDVGNYGFTRAAGYAACAAAAREIGDHDSARLLLSLFDEECPKVVRAGASHHRGASLWAHGWAFVARIGRPHGLRALIEAPPAPRRGPHLAEAPYPDVLIARAAASANGLDLVLRQGVASNARALVAAGLRPGAVYAIDGEAVGRASKDGALAFDVAFDVAARGRRALELEAIG